jgi:cation:H+ antiporter
VSDSPDFTDLAEFIQAVHPYLLHPMTLLVGFIVASFVMIWRLQAVEGKGFEGTVVGTLIMPYCSGFANLAFVYVMRHAKGGGKSVIENCLVNNVTNLTLILGMAALLYTTVPQPKAEGKKGKHTAAIDQSRLYRLDMLLTLVAMFLFTGASWALAKDRVLDFYDGLVLIGLFLFWQVLHVFEVMKNNVRKNQSFRWSIILDLVIIGAAAYVIYLSVDYLVQWVNTAHNPYIKPAYLGWFSGVIMVVPNALLALYYAHVGRQDIVVTSQVGDGHICIPMCMGLYALLHNIPIPPFFQLGVLIIFAAGALNFLSIAVWGRLPRVVGALLLCGYAVFLYKGLGS